MRYLTRSALAALAALVVAGCGTASGPGSGGPGSGRPGSSGGQGSSEPRVTALQTALARVADTANTRSAVYYDDTSQLTGVVGKNPHAVLTGYGQLIGTGAEGLLNAVATLQAHSGISLLSEDYAISAGRARNLLTLVAGGQDAATITRRLTAAGFQKSSGGTYTPTKFTVAGTAGLPDTNRVRVQGSDVMLGTAGANLDQIGSPSGATLAGDAGVKALASCLGDVSAAVIYSDALVGATARPAEVAAGVRPPASATAAARAVLCVSFPTQAAADRYAANARKALSAGVAPVGRERYSAIFPHASVTEPGGSAHVVQWQAGESPPVAIFVMLDNNDLPALSNCGLLNPDALAGVVGC